ncbi:MAG: hypothetical protein IMW99_08960 [Firmicutes bacterium]|nr:hypothetical protein [Bacillota bacterium]
MRAAIIHSRQPRVARLAKALQEAFEDEGWQAECLEAVGAEERPRNLAAYDLVVVGAPAVGFLASKVGEDVPEYLGHCLRLEGKRSAAFIPKPTFGGGKALRHLMAALEKQGAQVLDFEILSGAGDAGPFVKRLVAVAE